MPEGSIVVTNPDRETAAMFRKAKDSSDPVPVYYAGGEWLVYAYEATMRKFTLVPISDQH